MDRVDRKDVKDAAFDVALRGYDKRQVDERLRFLGSELTAAEDALRAAGQRAAMLEEALSEARATPGDELSDQDDHMSLPNFGARVEKILKLAQDEAREVRSQADAAAAALIEQARAQAGEQRQRAEQEIAGWRTEAGRRAAAARAEADQLVVAARAEAERLISVATDTVHQRERSSAHELHQLSRLHEEINADLYRAKEVLDGLFGSTRAISGATSHPILPQRRQDVVHPPHQARTV